MTDHPPETRLAHAENEDPTSTAVVLVALLRGISEDAWTEGPVDEVALRLHRLRVLGDLVAERAAACEQTLVDSMESNELTVPYVGVVRRVERSSSAWKFKHSAADLRSDLTTAVAQSVAIDIATGDIDPMKRNVALATMRLALEAIPAFSSLNKAGRDRLGLHIGDYRDFATSYRVAIESLEEGS